VHQGIGPISPDHLGIVAEEGRVDPVGEGKGGPQAGGKSPQGPLVRGDRHHQAEEGGAQDHALDTVWVKLSETDNDEASHAVAEQGQGKALPLSPELFEEGQDVREVVREPTDVPPLARALSVSSEVECRNRPTPGGKPVRQGLVASGVLAVAGDDPHPADRPSGAPNTHEELGPISRSKAALLYTPSHATN
jgi:hypothetical protein